RRGRHGGRSQRAELPGRRTRHGADLPRPQHGQQHVQGGAAQRRGGRDRAGAPGPGQTGQRPVPRRAGGGHREHGGHHGHPSAAGGAALMTPYTLVLNAGSSSLKYQLVQPDSGDIAAKGIVERIGGSLESYADALAKVRADLPHADITVVGHRVVHGGERFREPTVITAEVLSTIRELIPLAPLHNPANAAIIEVALAALPDVPQVAVFDTAFFAGLPEVATTYAIDREVADRNGIRRYGFHGISHEYVSHAAAELLGRPHGELKQIVLHLGNGASASAIEAGRP